MPRRMKTKVPMLQGLVDQQTAALELRNTCRIGGCVHIMAIAKSTYNLFELRCEKIGLRGFRPGPT